MTFESEMQRIVDQCKPGLLSGTTNPSRNLITVIEEIKSSPRLFSSFQEEAHKRLLSLNYVRALTRAGLANESGFTKEVFKRFEYVFLPRAYDENDALGLFTWLSSSKGSMEWVEYLDEDVLGDFLGLLVKDHLEFIGHVAPQLFESLEILGLMLSHYAVEEKISDRLEGRPDLKEAFFTVQRIIARLIETQAAEAIVELERCLETCESAAEHIRGERHEKGISLDLTYHLIRVGDICDRMRKIINILKALYGEWDPLPVSVLVKDILVSETKRFDLKAYLSKNASLLAYEITEHTGRTGEHYITTNRSQYEAMLKSAVIGGLIVGFLSLIKTSASMVGFPPFFEAVIFSFIYAAGFLIIHSVGGVIATKQPAMTAARIGAALDQGKNSDDSMYYLCEMVVQTIRSQLIALIGNYAFAFPVAALASFAMMSMGLPLINEYKAESLLTSLHPFKSLSFLYAAIAGVCLFISGILAGMANNWFIFNKVGKRLKKSRVINLFADPENIDVGVERISQNIGYWVGNTSLGIFLGSMGTIGAIFGLPLDIRHITFASAQAGTALTHLQFEESFGLVAMILISVFIMGLINLAVSFSLAMFLAIKSRGIRFLRTGELLRLLAQRFRSRPLDFFIPPKE